MKRIGCLVVVLIIFNSDSHSQNEIAKGHFSKKNGLDFKVVSPPGLTVQSTDSIICSGQTVTLTALGSGSFTWNTGSTGNVLIVSPTITTTYSVTETDENNNMDTATVLVTVKPIPTLSLNNPTICPGMTTTVFANVTPVNGVTFFWQSGGTTGSSIMVSPSVTSNYTVTAFLNGCAVTVSNTVTVKTNASPVIDFLYNSPVCSGDQNPVPFTVADFDFGGYFFSGTGLNINTVTGLINLPACQPGTFVVTYSIAANSCTSAGTSTALLVIETTPTLVVSPDIEIGPGSSTTLTASGASLYGWSPSSGLSCNDCPNPVASPLQSSQYCVIAKNLSCAVKACISVKVGCEGGDLSLPNAFTPNGDGYNDAFCLQGWNLCLDYFSVLIFDRWGEKVYESNNPSFCWDGIYKSKPLETDVYVYAITASFTNGSRVDKKETLP